MMREMPLSSTPLQSYDGTGLVPGGWGGWMWSCLGLEQ